jgi:hypothetical protein
LAPPPPETAGKEDSVITIKIREERKREERRGLVNKFRGGESNTQI